MNRLFYICEINAYAFVAIIIVITYKIVLHVIGLVLACLTRKIEIDVLNDYKSTVVIVICSSILSIAIGGILAANKEQVTQGLLSLPLLAIHLGFTFIPKVCFR